jgi:hypothetical protein
MSQQIKLLSLNDALGNSQSFNDSATWETIQRFSAVTFDEDFTGPALVTIPNFGSPVNGCPWVKKLVKDFGSPSVAILANYSGGAVRLALDATSEAQEATLYANDVLNWDMTKCAIWEARISNHVLPTGNAEIVFGLQSAWASGPDNASFYAQFQEAVGGTGLVNFRTQDGVNTLAGASPITMVVDTFHIFRIDATDPTNIRFFIDGVEVSSRGQTSFAATGANAVLQPYVSVYKASGTGVATVDVDMIQIAMNRQ